MRLQFSRPVSSRQHGLSGNKHLPSYDEWLISVVQAEFRESADKHTVHKRVNLHTPWLEWPAKRSFDRCTELRWPTGLVLIVEEPCAPA